MTKISIIDLVPPHLCRLLACHRGRPVSNRELARRSGLSRDAIERIAAADTWDLVRVGEARRFIRACNLSPRVLKVRVDWLRRTHPLHWQQKEYFVKLLRLFHDNQRNRDRVPFAGTSRPI